MSGFFPSSALALAVLWRCSSSLVAADIYSSHEKGAESCHHQATRHMMCINPLRYVGAYVVTLLNLDTYKLSGMWSGVMITIGPPKRSCSLSNLGCMVMFMLMLRIPSLISSYHFVFSVSAIDKKPCQIPLQCKCRIKEECGHIRPTHDRICNSRARHEDSKLRS